VGTCLIKKCASPSRKRKFAEVGERDRPACGPDASISTLWSVLPETRKVSSPPPSSPPLFISPSELRPPSRLGIALCGERWRLPTTGLDSSPARGGGTRNAVQVAAPSKRVDVMNSSLPPKLLRILVPLHGRKRDSNDKVFVPMPKDGTPVNVVREKDNPVDSRALLCTSLLAQSEKLLDAEELRNVLGYLPRQVSTHLSPLIDEGLIFLTAWSRSTLTDTPMLLEGSSTDGMIELSASLCSPTEVLREEQLMLVASSWSAASQASEDAHVGLQEVIRRRFWSAFGRIRCSAHAHLLDTVEVCVLETFHRCSLRAQRLAFRLLQRKATWFRTSSLQYSEIPHIEAAVDELRERGIVLSGDDREVDENMEARLSALKSDELIILSKRLGLEHHRNTRKKLIGTILSSSRDISDSDGGQLLFHTWLSIFNGRSSGMVRLCPVLLRSVEVVNYLTFLRPDCGLQSFVLEDVGVIRYPPHRGSLDDGSALFTSRSDLDAYLSVIAEASAVDAALDAGDEKTALNILDTNIFPWVNSCSSVIHSLKHQNFRRRFEPDWVRAKMATIGITLLERHGRLTDAVAMLTRLLSCPICPERRGTWYLRLIINSNHLGRLKDATQACDRALQDPWVRCGDRLGIQRRALRLARKVKSWGTLGARWRSDILWEAPIDSIRAQALNGSVREKKRYCTISEVGEATVSVEELAIMHYAEEDAGSWRGVHSESRAWMTLFGLLFADVILSPVPGVFHGPFQSAPLDLGTDSFVEVRRDDITKILSEIRRGKGPKIVRDVWRRYYGTAIYGVSWVLLSLDELCDIILGLGGAALAEVMGLIAEDTSGWTGGAPDLLLWRHSSCEPKVKAVEVKSKNDQLSDQQRAWLLALRDAGVTVAVCRVSF
jgi:Fanconi-associated nuclease 1